MTKSNILVTGGTGTIGSEIVRQLIHQTDKNIVVLSRDEIKQFIFSREINSERLKLITGDVTNRKFVDFVFSTNNFESVFHAAAMKHLLVCEDNPEECARVNIEGTKNIVENCLEHGVSKTINISTDKAASPVSVMGASKFIAERISLNKNYSPNSIFSVVRFGNVACSRGSVIPVMLNDVLQRGQILVSDPNVTRFVMSTKSAVELVLRSHRLMKGNEIFILKMEAFRLGRLAEIIKEISKTFFKKDIEISYGTLSPNEKLHEDLISASKSTKIYENKDMYVVNDSHTLKNYQGFNEVSEINYKSNTTSHISDDDLREMVEEYILNNNIKFYD
ncbi:MAG: SDR family NAD(P)-dependent oxidoreductase [Candidatus Thermoplasmatota archaeon]|nr:SDR family NAD(P)-dependent oxidoreductase [Candidatus Thermoplasmatota archaeon]